jgi:predicted translin family RNA/ssDNA-binding protein
MKDIYDMTRSLRFAEATLQGLRKKQDVARIQIENAGNEILYFNAAKQG